MAQEHKHDKYYHGPSFPFFGSAFIADTMHLEPEEVGAYTLLLIHSWESFGIPRDLRRVGAITKVPRRRIRAVWTTLSTFWTDHPTCELCLVSPRQEEERANERLRVELAHAGVEQRRENGRSGGRPRSQNRKPEVSKNAPKTGESQNRRLSGRLFAEEQLETTYPTDTPSSTSPSDSLRSSSGDASGQAPDAEIESWQKRLREAARALSNRTIASFTPDERQIAAQYHCLLFGNCTKSESSNKARATQVAAGFASMARNKTYGQITFSEYVSYARQVHKKRDAKPWFDVWHIRGEVEFDQEQAS